MPSGRELLGVVLLYLGANTNLDDYEVVDAFSMRPLSKAQSTQSLMILACAGPNLGRLHRDGVASGLSLKTWGL